MYNVRPIIKEIIEEKALNQIYFDGISYYSYEFFSHNITIQDYLKILQKNFRKKDFYDVMEEKQKIMNLILLYWLLLLIKGKKVIF